MFQVCCGNIVLLIKFFLAIVQLSRIHFNFFQWNFQFSTVSQSVGRTQETNSLDKCPTQWIFIEYLMMAMFRVNHSRHTYAMYKRGTFLLYERTNQPTIYLLEGVISRPMAIRKSTGISWREAKVWGDSWRNRWLHVAYNP